MTDLLVADGLVKRFPLPGTRPTSVKQRLLGRSALPPLLTAVDGVSLNVARSECLGLIGANGSGKTTLLRLLAGIYVPTAGTVTVHGRAVALLQLGAGFSADLTGHDNVRLAFALYGHDERSADRLLPEIAAFAELGDWLARPLKTYSQGMQLRLGFAVAAHLPHDVLLLDEVLAVGDERFRARCHARLQELRAAGSTIIVASHDLPAVARHCTRVLLLAGGRVACAGDPATVLARYRAAD